MKELTTWGKVKSLFSNTPIGEITYTPPPRTEAFLTGSNLMGSGGNRNHVFTFSYSGEKNLGEMGPAIDYNLDYDLLRIRSWQSQLESDVCKTVIKRFVTWVVGEGLKLQCEPEISVLKSEGIVIDKQAFSENIESRYGLYKRSLKSDYAQMKKLDMLASTIETNAIVGGDVLVIQRFDGKNLNVQVIDGAHVQSPGLGSEYYPAMLANGNRVINGIELSPEGKHVAFYVNTYSMGGVTLQYERIEAESKSTGLSQAFLVYGSEHRLNNVRGLPLLAACLETAKKMERYKEATLGSAEEIAKIVYQVVHQIYSDGSNPLADRIATTSGYTADKPELARDAAGVKIANTVAATTNKTSLNMPVGSELKTVDNKGTLSFAEFYRVNIDLLCATVGIPPNVAMSKYDDSFSASRAAIKDWENTLKVERGNFAFAFYQKNYEFWLHIQILMNKVIAPGYLFAWKYEDDTVLCAYRKTRWVGAQVPHIDPVKEVNAERLKLGEGASMVPLTTIEAATERLDGGEAPSNMEQFAQEISFAKEVGIDLTPIPTTTQIKKEGE